MSSSFLMVNDQSAKESSPIGPNRIADALLTRMSIPPARSTAATEIHADQDALWRGVLEAQSIKRRGETEDVARAILFLGSDEASHVSGANIPVDGGAAVVG